MKKGERRSDKAPTLTDLRPVVFDDLGTNASVGWHGDVEYFPITPLLALTRFASEDGLLKAIWGDPETSDLPEKFMINRLRGAPSWHLPWSHFSIFCVKFGNEKTKPQQDRVQLILETGLLASISALYSSVPRTVIRSTIV